MKKAILIMTIITTVGFLSCKNEKKDVQTKSKEPNTKTIDLSFGVRGNCNTCKKTIEKAINTVNGVRNAIFDVEKKKIEVSFDSTKTNEASIHNAIANSGYDTDKVKGVLEAYNNLPKCCQYNRSMKMSLDVKDQSKQ